MIGSIYHITSEDISATQDTTATVQTCYFRLRQSGRCRLHLQELQASVGGQPPFQQPDSGHYKRWVRDLGSLLPFSSLLRDRVNSNLSGSPAKSGPLDFGTKNNFPSFFVSEKGLTYIYIKKQFIIFQHVIFVFVRAIIEFWPNWRCRPWSER